MGSVRYIGSKARVVAAIIDRLGPPGEGLFVDVFAGTGIVSREASRRGWEVWANDHLLASTAMATAQLLSAADVPFATLGGYGAAIQRLNAARPRRGFIFREYTPSARSASGHRRRYFTCANGMRIDGMRALVEEWYERDNITPAERTLLLADLLEAVNAVANTAGTYGCYLRHWIPPALRPIRLTPRELLPNSRPSKVTSLDAFKLLARPFDVVYLDPPYTKRQYAAYYHILETIAAGDKPQVGGVTGLRPWQDKLSDFCYKRRALGALVALALGIGARRVLISYNSQGHITLNELRKALACHGEVRLQALADVGRYRPSQAASAAGTSVTEYLIEFTRPARAIAAAKRHGAAAVATRPLAEVHP